MYPRVIGHEFRPVPSILQGRYAPHPLLQAVLSPGTYGRVTHTAEGHRATVNLNKAPNALTRRHGVTRTQRRVAGEPTHRIR
jgi:hypothetical protein